MEFRLLSIVSQSFRNSTKLARHDAHVLLNDAGKIALSTEPECVRHQIDWPACDAEIVDSELKP